MKYYIITWATDAPKTLVKARTLNELKEKLIKTLMDAQGLPRTQVIGWAEDGIKKSQEITAQQYTKYRAIASKESWPPKHYDIAIKS